jgi:hypothetical protein
VTQWYASVNPGGPFSGYGQYGPLLEIRLAGVTGAWAEIYNGTSVTRVKNDEGIHPSTEPILLPEPLVRELYERLQTYYGGVPNSSVEKVLTESLKVERARIDRVLDMVVLA